MKKNGTIIGCLHLSFIHTIEPTGFIITVGTTNPHVTSTSSPPRDNQNSDNDRLDVSFDDLGTPPPPHVGMSRDASKGSASMEMSSVGSPDSECTSHNKSSSTEGLNESGEPLIQCTDNNLHNNIATCMCTCM